MLKFIKKISKKYFEIEKLINTIYVLLLHIAYNTDEEIFSIPQVIGKSFECGKNSVKIDAKNIWTKPKAIRLETSIFLAPTVFEKFGVENPKISFFVPFF